MITKKNKDFARQLEDRTRKYAYDIIRLSSKLNKGIEGDIIRKQITKSGTSIGANYHEANRSRSLADFKNKIKICQGESNETHNWLKVIQDQGWIPEKDLEDQIKETSELIALFTSISGKLVNKRKTKG